VVTSRYFHAPYPVCAEPACGNVFEVLRSEPRFEPAASRFDAQSGSLDDNGFGDPVSFKDHRPLECRARADAEILFVIRRKSRQLDVEHVRAGRSSGNRNCPHPLPHSRLERA